MTDRQARRAIGGSDLGAAAPPREAPRTLDRPERRANVLSLAVLALVVLAGFFTLYSAREFFIPVVAALVLNLLFSPLMRLFARLRLPSAFGAALIVTGLLGGMVFSIYALAEPATEWRHRIPQITRELDHKLRALKRPVEEMQRASEEVQKITTLGSEGEAPREILVQSQSVLERVVVALKDFGAQLLFVVVLLYFLLASGDPLRDGLIRSLPKLRDKKKVVAISRDAERQVSRYLLTITVINGALGLAIGLALHAIGLPNAPLWGVMAAILNFVPYLGALTGAITIAIVGLLSFDDLGRQLAPAGVYVALNVIESQFVTPSILGRSLMVNPVIVFVAVIFWTWLWGIPGALLAMPLLVTAKAFSDHAGPRAGSLRKRGGEIPRRRAQSAKG